MTETETEPAPRRVAPPLLIAAILVVAVVAGVGGGSLLAGMAGAGRSPAPTPTDLAVVPPTPTAAPTPTPTAAPTPAPKPTPQPTAALVAAPLTGLPITEAAALQRPIAVMVDDQKDARPQAGFNAADIVWQAPAEGGIPRYMLVFQSRLPASIGPIRSARQYFIEWAAELQAMYVHIGGSGQALATLRAKGHGQLVYNADGLRFDGSDMYRVKTRVAPHNLYSDAQHVLAMQAAVGAKNGPLKPAWSFGPPLVAEARPDGTTITIHYPYETITYRYDATSNTYQRFIDGSKTPQVDDADGSPVGPANVVLLRMRFGPLNDGHPEKHRLEAQDVGSGEAIVSMNGRVIHGKWKKAAVGAPTLLFAADGTPITLTAGQTFVQVIALSYSYEVRLGRVPPVGNREK